MSGATGDNGGVILEHLGRMHAHEHALVLLLAFGPLVLLAVTIKVARRREQEDDR